MKVFKRVLLFTVLLCFSSFLNSQVVISLIFGKALNNPNTQFGMEVGANAVSITNYSPASVTGGLEIGMFFNWKYSDNWALYSNLIANSNRGFTGTEDLLDPDYIPGNDYEFKYMKTRLAYGGVQSAMRYYINPSFSVAGGINISLRFKATEEGQYSKDGSDLSIVYKVNDAYRWLDGGPTLAFIYQFRKGKGFSIIGRGYYGLVDVAKNISGNQNNYFFQLTAGILIGAKKAEVVDKDISGQ